MDTDGLNQQPADLAKRETVAPDPCPSSRILERAMDPKWNPGNWNKGLTPAVPWWLNFHPYPHFGRANVLRFSESFAQSLSS